MTRTAMVKIDLHHLRLTGPPGNKKYEIQLAVPAALREKVAKLVGHRKPQIGALTRSTGCRPDEAARAVAIRDIQLPRFQAIIEEARKPVPRHPISILARLRSINPSSTPRQSSLRDTIEYELLRVRRQPIDHEFYRETVDQARRFLGNPDEPAEPVTIVDPDKIIDLWAREKGFTETDPPVKSKRRAMARFFAWLDAGHSNMVLVTTDDLIRYKEYLLERLGDPTDPSVKKSKTVADQLSEVRALFRWAFDNKKFPKEHLNPGEGVHYKGKTDDRDKYQAFTRDEIRTILREARKCPHPFVRWFHWLAAYSGARVAEIAEAQTQDIEILPDGTAVFHIRLNNRPPKQRLKTEFSPRPMPLHAHVLNEGFLSYVEWVRRTYGEGPLFPMLKFALGRLHHDASHQSMEWLRSIGIGVLPDGSYDRRKANHSWRHTIKTRFRETDAAGNHFIPREDVVDKLTGHANGSIGREYGYFPITMLKHNIDRVPAWEV